MLSEQGRSPRVTVKADMRSDSDPDRAGWAEQHYSTGLSVCETPTPKTKSRLSSKTDET